MAEDYDYERTLCQLPHAHAFRIPPRKNAEGHRASDWPKEPIWTGKLKITSKGKLAIIYLLDDANKIFATCPVNDDSCVERTLDSGRYFVLKIVNNQNKHAFIGLAFNERNDAFDMNVALSEHKSELEREARAQDSSAVVAPSRDFTIKEGEKIKVSIGVPKKKRDPPATGSSSFLAPPPNGAAKGSLLAPPPSTFDFPAPAKSTGASVSNLTDSFGSMGFSSDPFAAFDAPKPQAPKKSSASQSTDLLDF